MTTTSNNLRLGFCVKRPVSAVLTFKDGRTLVGGNYCTNPQLTCPRLPGEGYAKCYSICGQIGHAEEVVIRLLRSALDGGPTTQVKSIDIYNHDRPCDGCKRLLKSYGVEQVTRFHPMAMPAAITEDEVRNIDKEYALTLPGGHSNQNGGTW